MIDSTELARLHAERQRIAALSEQEQRDHAIQVIINHPNFPRVVALLRQWGRERLERHSADAHVSVERAALNDSELTATDSKHSGDGDVLDCTPDYVSQSQPTSRSAPSS